MPGLEASELLGGMCLMHEVSKLLAGLFWRMRSVLLVVCASGCKISILLEGLYPRV